MTCINLAVISRIDEINIYVEGRHPFRSVKSRNWRELFFKENWINDLDSLCSDVNRSESKL